MRADDVAADRQAEPRADSRSFGRKESLEEPMQVLRTNPGSVVNDAGDDVLALTFRGHDDFIRLPRLLREGLRRVHEQIDEDLRDLPRASADLDSTGEAGSDLGSWSKPGS